MRNLVKVISHFYIFFFPAGVISTATSAASRPWRGFLQSRRSEDGISLRSGRNRCDCSQIQLGHYRFRKKCASDGVPDPGRGTSRCISCGTSGFMGYRPDRVGSVRSYRIRRPRPEVRSADLLAGPDLGQSGQGVFVE